jgi:methyl-accepting chemotaxis protein
MNMAMAEEAAAVSDKMSDQAQKLKGLIREFHLDGVGFYQG